MSQCLPESTGNGAVSRTIPIQYTIGLLAYEGTKVITASNDAVDTVEYFDSDGSPLVDGTFKETAGVKPMPGISVGSVGSVSLAASTIAIFQGILDALLPNSFSTGINNHVEETVETQVIAASTYTIPANTYSVNIINNGSTVFNVGLIPLQPGGNLVREVVRDGNVLQAIDILPAVPGETFNAIISVQAAPGLITLP